MLRLEPRLLLGVLVPSLSRLWFAVSLAKSLRQVQGGVSEIQGIGCWQR